MPAGVASREVRQLRKISHRNLYALSAASGGDDAVNGLWACSRLDVLDAAFVLAKSEQIRVRTKCSSERFLVRASGTWFGVLKRFDKWLNDRCL